jgi:hypothetical protein
MPFAQGSRFDIGIQVETTYGTAPAVPTLVALPATSFALNPTKTLLTSDSFSSTGQRNYQRHGNVAVAGDIAFDFADTDFDELLQGVMNSTFSTGVLKHGTGIRSYHIEGRMNDNTDYKLVKGAVVNQLALSMALDANVTGTASFIAKDSVSSGTSFDSTMTASANTPPFTGHEVTVSWKGVTAKASSASLTIANNFSSNYVLGSDLLEELSKGFIDVTGSFEAYYTSSTLDNDFRDEVEDDLSIAITDGTNTYTFLMPKVKLTSADSTVTGQGAIIITAGFSAVYDATEATTLKITKV